MGRLWGRRGIVLCIPSGREGGREGGEECLRSWLGTLQRSRRRARGMRMRRFWGRRGIVSCIRSGERGREGGRVCVEWLRTEEIWNEETKTKVKKEETGPKQMKIDKSMRTSKAPCRPKTGNENKTQKQKQQKGLLNPTHSKIASHTLYPCTCFNILQCWCFLYLHAFPTFLLLHLSPPPRQPRLNRLPQKSQPRALQRNPRRRPRLHT